jgi:hypothetical protein
VDSSQCGKILVCVTCKSGEQQFGFRVGKTKNKFTVNINRDSMWRVATG